MIQATTKPVTCKALFGANVEVGGFETAEGRPWIAIKVTSAEGEARTIALGVQSAAALAYAISAAVGGSAVDASFSGTVEIDREAVAVERRGLLAELLGLA